MQELLLPKDRASVFEWGVYQYMALKSAMWYTYFMGTTSAQWDAHQSPNGCMKGVERADSEILKPGARSTSPSPGSQAYGLSR